MSTITAQFDLHTRLFNNVLSGVSNESASPQIGPHSNSIQFLAGHLVFTRLMLKDFAGLPADDRFAAFDKNFDPQATYLPLSEIISKWNEIAGPLSKAIASLPIEALQAPGPFPVPTGTRMEEFLGFIMHHEAYHMGQLGILRKMAGNQAMTYA